MLLLIYWILSIFYSLTKFVILCLYNRDNYYLLVRVQCILFSFFIYSSLAFYQLTNILNQFSISKKCVTINVEYNEDKETINSCTSCVGQQIRYRRNYSSLFSKATFSWFFAILTLGYSRPLQLTDLGSLPQEETAYYQFSRFLKCFKATKNLKSLQLWTAYWKTFWKSLAFGAIIKIFADLFGLIGPLSINLILNYVNQTQTIYSNINPDVNVNQLYGLNLKTFFLNGYIIACVVLFATLLQSTFSNNFNHLVIAEGIHLKTALNCLVYNKSLRMTVQSGIDIGSTLNLMSIDSFNMFMLFSMGHYLWAVPLKILLLLYLMYYHLGYSAMIGAATIYILAPLQYYISRQLSKIQKQELDISDERLRKTTELFMGIKLLKLLGWEMAFADSVKNVREKEIRLLRKDAVYVALNTFITQGSSIIVTLVTFALYPYIEGKPLTSAKVFTGLALFNQLTVPLYIIPLVIPILISAIVSTKRLVKFLNLPEVDSSILWRKTNASNGDTNPLIHQNDDQSLSISLNIKNNQSLYSIEDINQMSSKLCSKSSAQHLRDTENMCCIIRSGYFAWIVDQSNKAIPFLKNINIFIPKEKLTLIVGTIGSGKSSLLSAMIGEMVKIKGDIHWSQINSFIGYVGESPWLINMSLKENITFGYPFDQKRYNKVIEACALQADIDILPNRDLTEIGERGINLSGGQKQRIALARAIYSPANTLVLDDTLSALDPIVGTHVFEQAIKKLLIGENRTVILVTHKLEYLSQANHIIVVESGTIVHQGCYNEIEKCDPDLFAFWNKTKNNEEEAKRRATIDDCGTTKERHKLVRLISKQVGFRGNVSDAMPKQKRHISFNRQISHDPSSPLPCHDWNDNDEHLPQTQITETTHNRPSTPFKRIKSIDSLASKSSYASSMLSSSPDSSIMWSRPAVTRLNSRISDYSFTGNSIKEENEDEDDLNQNDSDLEDDIQNEATCHYGHERTSSVATVRLIPEEERETGSIPKRIYVSYAKACSLWLTFIVILLIISNQTFKVASDFWLAKWSESEVTLINDEMHLEYYIKGYAILSCITIIISLVTNLSSQLTSLRAVRLLHSNMLESVVRCPMRFFDTTPLGRIINRFSTDINTIDKKLPIALPVLLRFLFLCVSAIIVDIIITPYFTIAIIPILFIYYFLQHFFRYTSRELQRLDSITKSPIFSLYSQTIDGLATIRAFREEFTFIEKLYELIDINNLCFLMVNSANCWLGIALDYLGGIILFSATIAAISAAIHLSISPALVGMAMTYTLLVPIYLNWVVRNLASVEIYMNSVERVNEFSVLQNEDQKIDPFFALPNDWPQKGDIRFNNVDLKYDSKLEPIIKGANFHIETGEKVGICGRTGCGKSSLMSSLFRINQISSGSILIDNIDISLISSQILRNRLSIIPQDVVLFSGTIRENLDPNYKKSDEEIWSVLEQFNLNKIISSLNDIVTEEGLGLSAGQRQLLCTARAFLRQSPILIMDESTSSLDKESEELILSTIAKSNRTVISIAHNITNIINYDKIIVLDQGIIAEIGSPQQLLAKRDSIFSSLLNKQRKLANNS